MGIVIKDGNIVVSEIEQRFHIRVQDEFRQRSRIPRKLQPRLFEMIEIEMRIAERMHEIACFQPAALRDHRRHQGVTCDVEGHAEKDIGRALVELARQLSVGDIELKQAVTRRERHLVEIADIPCGHDEPARIRIAADFVDDPLQLIVRAPVSALPRAPLLAIDGTEIA